ncbi:glutathione S-transferase [Variovorax sp. EBFNA2]|uniref:glutathione S-transferase family protein n=1 Tax=Variovorax sp. EBFNA2 TaxID=3342097 RepID=UPI0029BFF018|nr:glutathione S-transferase [Variovorax boronicumulans]WPG41239.1 glutathione S-transferase [Variovorax boronicumulans]
MSEIRFWYAAGACSLAPHVLLHEINAEFEGVEAQITAERARFPDGFEVINPKMSVPVISVDGQVFTEVPAIATVIAGMAPERFLMGRDALETARVYEWMVWLSTSLHGIGFGGIWRPQRYSDDPAASAGIVKKGRQTVVDCFATIERRIIGPFAIGEAFSAADAYLYVFYRWGNGIGMDMDQVYPKFAALGRTLASRPSVVKALAVEKVDPHGHGPS